MNEISMYHSYVFINFWRNKIGKQFFLFYWIYVPTTILWKGETYLFHVLTIILFWSICFSETYTQETSNWEITGLGVFQPSWLILCYQKIVFYRVLYKKKSHLQLDIFLCLTLQKNVFRSLPFPTWTKFGEQIAKNWTT